MTLEIVFYILAGMGILAVVGLIPIVGAVFWFVKTYPTNEDLRGCIKEVREDLAELSARVDNTEEDIQSGQLNYVEMKGVMLALKDAVVQLTNRIDKLPFARSLPCPTCSVATDRPGGAS